MSGTQRVLVVEDEEDIRFAVSRWLDASGYESRCEQDGEAGLQAAQTDHPDVILMDVLMPKKDGLQTLAELRACPATQDIPVVMLSASLRDEQRALDAGARFFVHKPYSGSDLISAVKAAAKRDG